VARSTFPGFFPYLSAGMAVAAGTFERQVRDALARLHDPTYLQTHPLTRVIRPSPSPGAAGSGGFLHGALLESIESLRPDSRLSTRSVLRRRHQILELRYARGLDAPEVQARLGIAKTHYYRQHQEALAALVSRLRERWLPDGDGQPVPAATFLHEMTSAPAARIRGDSRSLADLLHPSALNGITVCA